MARLTHEMTPSGPIRDADGAMSAYAHGETSAFAEVYDAVAPRLEAFLLRHSRDRALIEDVIQQTFLQMHAARGSFIPGSPVAPWSVSIAWHIFLDLRRKRAREESWDPLAEEAPAVAFSAEPDGEAWVAGRELGDRLRRAYGALTASQREAVELRTAGLTIAGAARALNTTPMGIKLRVHRALAILRGALVVAAPGRDPWSHLARGRASRPLPHERNRP